MEDRIKEIRKQNETIILATLWSIVSYIKSTPEKDLKPFVEAVFQGIMVAIGHKNA